jgi:hypothetical protein
MDHRAGDINNQKEQRLPSRLVTGDRMANAIKYCSLWLPLYTYTIPSSGVFVVGHLLSQLPPSSGPSLCHINVPPQRSAPSRVFSPNTIPLAGL